MMEAAENFTVYLGDHGLRRVRKRSGIPKKAAERQIRRVIARGKNIEDDKKLRDWVKYKRDEHGRHDQNDHVYIAYGNYIYSFEVIDLQMGKEYRLVTVLNRIENDFNRKGFN